jgi:hypothetical protein
MEYITYIERKFDRKPKIIRVDGGGEFVNDRMRKWCAEKGIELQTTAPYSPSQNGVAERFNRTLIELTRAMLFGRNLPTFLWAEAVRHAAYLRNRAPTIALDGKTPEEAWSGKKPNVAHHREFGCDVWILIEGDKSKLSPKSEKYTFVGFEDGPKAVRYYDAQTRKIKVSRNFIFSEAENKEPATEIETSPRLELEGENKGDNDPQSRETPNTPNNALTPTTMIPDVQTSTIPRYRGREIQDIPLRRTARNISDHNYKRMDNPASRLPAAPREQRPQPEPTEEPNNDEVHYAFMTTDAAGMDLPQSISEARASGEWQEWAKGIKAEYNLLMEMGTWKLEDLPEGRNTVGCRWTFVRKYDAKGKIVRHKARLVAQGFSQQPGTDFNETFAPGSSSTARPTSSYPSHRSHQKPRNTANGCQRSVPKWRPPRRNLHATTGRF